MSSYNYDGAVGGFLDTNGQRSSRSASMTS